ncbi:MAG: DUF481 domain-containing protein [Deltaproteobacteria bacterium]|nr:DUF481 domain-containing protein [Deltaproteobacteria bacterium]
MIPKRFLGFCGGIAAVVLLSVQAVCADTVVLKNGDTITGKITGGSKGSLVIFTDYSSPITVKTNTISKITMTEPLNVQMKNGTSVKGTFAVGNNGNLEIQTGQGVSPSTLNWDQIRALNPPPSTVTGSVTAGANTQNGNAHVLSASIGANVLWKSTWDNAGLRFLYNYAQSEGVMSARNVFGSAKYEHLFTDAFYGYADVEMLSDKFRDLRLRTAEGPGVGYQLWSTPSATLSVEAGYSYFTEDHFVGTDGSWSTLRAAGTFLWALGKMVSFSEYFVMYDRLDKKDNYTTRNEASLTSALAGNLALKVSNIIEYNRTPPPGIYRMDIFWILGVQYTF